MNNLLHQAALNAIIILITNKHKEDAYDIKQSM